MQMIGGRGWFFKGGGQLIHSGEIIGPMRIKVSRFVPGDIPLFVGKLVSG